MTLVFLPRTSFARGVLVDGDVRVGAVGGTGGGFVGGS